MEQDDVMKVYYSSTTVTADSSTTVTAVGPQTELLPTTHIYAALVILVLGVMLGKFFL